MKKLLVVINTAFVSTGGLASVMLNYYREIDKEGIRIDFASTNEIADALLLELTRNGSKYYCLGARNNVLAYFINLFRTCKGYDIVHVNGNSATATIELLASKIAGVPVRIAHNHNTKTSHPIIHHLLLPIFRSLYTMGLACSEEAGNWLFGKGKFTVLRNAIDVDKYRFSENSRTIVRKELGIPENAFVIGHVGKYNTQKNHFKLLEVFCEYQKRHENVYLLCVGYGPLRAQIETMITNLGLSGKVILTGERTDVPELLSAMDSFVFPSNWEGLGLAVIEAQASGLPCLLSDRVPGETHLSDYVVSIPLEADNDAWADKIEEVGVPDRILQCERNYQSISRGGYNIKNEANKLKTLYVR